jgi:OmpA-OmpF porin, OOP family
MVWKSINDSVVRRVSGNHEGALNGGGDSTMTRTGILLTGVALLGGALCALTQPASAQQPVTGPYVSLGAGPQWLEDSKTTAPPLSQSFSHDVGPAVVGALGYGLGNGFRVEGEIGYRHSDLKSGSGSASALDFMANGLYDFNLGWPVVPYIGGGAGMARPTLDDANLSPTVSVHDTDTTFAYQGIAGLAYAITQNLKLDASYHYFATLDPIYQNSAGTRTHGEYRDHTLLIALRWEFGAPPPPPPAPMPAAAVTPPPPPPAIQRSYLVFFDFDKSDITPEASRVIQQAATTAKNGGVTRITATGHTDRAGTEQYNMALSIRRANAVKTALERQGIPANEIVVIGKGETQPLVPTPDGVREPQNRRVEIVLQ